MRYCRSCGTYWGDRVRCPHFAPEGGKEPSKWVARLWGTLWPFLAAFGLLGGLGLYLLGRWA